MIAVFSPGRRRAVFAAAALGYMLSQFYRSFLTVIVDELARDLGIGPRELGALGAAWFLTFGVSQLLVGVLLDRYGPRRSITGLMGFAVIGAFLFAGAGGVAEATLAMALIGFGCSAVLMGTLYFFARTEAPDRFVELSSVFLSAGLLGSLVAATPLAALVEAIGWRVSIRLIGGITVISMLLIWLTMRDPPPDPLQPAADTSLFGALIELVRRPALWPILFMSTFITAEVFSERALWVGPFLRDVHQLSGIARGNVILAMAIAMTLSAAIAGPIARRIGNPKVVVVVGSAGAAAAFLALGVFPSMPAGAAIVAICAIGLFGVTYAVQIAHARLFMPTHVIGRGITFVNFLSISGTGVLQYVSGRAVESMQAAGFSPEATYGWLHLIFGAIMAVSVIVYCYAPARPKA